MDGCLYARVTHSSTSADSRRQMKGLRLSSHSRAASPYSASVWSRVSLFRSQPSATPKCSPSSPQATPTLPDPREAAEHHRRPGYCSPWSVGLLIAVAELGGEARRSMSRTVVASFVGVVCSHAPASAAEASRCATTTNDDRRRRGKIRVCAVVYLAPPAPSSTNNADPAKVQRPWVPVPERVGDTTLANTRCRMGQERKGWNGRGKKQAAGSVRQRAFTRRGQCGWGSADCERLTSHPRHHVVGGLPGERGAASADGGVTWGAEAEELGTGQGKSEHLTTTVDGMRTTVFRS